LGAIRIENEKVRKWESEKETACFKEISLPARILSIRRPGSQEKINPYGMYPSPLLFFWIHERKHAVLQTCRSLFHLLTLPVSSVSSLRFFREQDKLLIQRAHQFFVALLLRFC
jgi:hypothetical protein